MTHEAFATAMAGFGPAPGRVAVAVSGGPHSLALALLTRQWARENGVALVALVAEHGLRRESAEEATGVATMLAGQGITTRVISLGLAGGASMQARARAARLKALLAACREWRAPWLLLGHHRMDQAETLLLRASHGQGRGQGQSGLAGMAASRPMAEALLLRPLLGSTPAALEAVCAAAALAPVRDPSNRNPAFARIRARLGLNDPGGEGPAVAALSTAATAFATRRARLEAALLQRLGAAVMLLPCGAARIDAAALGRDAVAVALLGRLLRALGGAEHAPAEADIARLLAAGQGTLGGAWWREDGWLLREPALLSPAIAADAGAVWDGRFHLAETWPGCMLGALGPGHPQAPPQHPSWPAALRAGLPALWRDGNLLAAPHLGWGSPVPSLSFRPQGGPIGTVFAGFAHLGHSPSANPTYVM
jgi:tRNA(Ile)-lysidine synthase